MPTSPTFNDAIDERKSIIARCEQIQPRDWGAEGAMMELMKQVGDLTRHVLVYEGYYPKRDDPERYSGDKKLIADELVDIFTGVIRLADHYDIDLYASIDEVRLSEDQWLKSKGA